MASRFVVQASGAMFDTIEPEAWCCVFGVFVTDQDGVPVQGLLKRHFKVWKLTSTHAVPIRLALELIHDFPDSSMPGIYRIQTDQVLGINAPDPQQFVFALRVAMTRSGVVKEGLTTVPISYLGKAKFPE